MAQVVDLAARLARSTYFGSAVLLAGDTPDGWAPRWGIEPQTAGETLGQSYNLSRFSTSRNDFQLETYPRESPSDKLLSIQALLDELIGEIEADHFTQDHQQLSLEEEQEEPLPLLRIAETLYRRDPGLLTSLIETDVTAHDVVAIAHRRLVVESFRRLLENEDVFKEATAEFGGRKEAVWQNLVEQNPWILGASLTGQLLTSWSEEKLEQVVAGFSVSGPGKRTDALMHTSGRIRALVFAEIKHHETDLLGQEYRPGVWAPSAELTGGVTQVQRTIHLAARQIGERLSETDDSGAETGEHTYLVRPRSFLILGNLDDLRGQGGVHRAKYESFELYRRNLYEPEVITFDELLARAEWHVDALDEGSEAFYDANIVDDEAES